MTIYELIGNLRVWGMEAEFNGLKEEAERDYGRAKGLEHCIIYYGPRRAVEWARDVYRLECTEN